MRRTLTFNTNNVLMNNDLFTVYTVCARFCTASVHHDMLMKMVHVSRVLTYFAGLRTSSRRANKYCLENQNAKIKIHSFKMYMTNICIDRKNICFMSQSVIWTNVGILLVGPLRTNSSKIVNEIHMFSFKKIRLKMSFGKCRPFCLNVLKWPQKAHQASVLGGPNWISQR